MKKNLSLILASFFLSTIAHARYLPLCFDRSAAVRACLSWQSDESLKALDVNDPRLTLVDNHSERSSDNRFMRFTSVAFDGQVICHDVFVSVFRVPGTTQLSCYTKCHAGNNMPEDCVSK